MRAHIGQQSRIRRSVFRPGVLTGWMALSAILGGCAAVGTSQLRGTSGPVAWEVTNLGQITSADQRRIRWSYTVVLKETAGSKIQFERVERGTEAPGAELYNATLRTDSLERRLDPNSAVQLHYVDSLGWVSGTSVPFGGTAGLAGIVVLRRYVGKDDRGNEITVPVRVFLDPGVGKRSNQPGKPGTLPPARVLQGDDLKTLAGMWRGHYRAGEFDIPLEVIIHEDGSFEAGENDPVTNRFRGNLRIVGGKIAYYQGRDTGTLTLHEVPGRRIAVGEITATSSSGQTAQYPIRLEAAAAPPTSTIAGEQSTVKLELPAWKPGDEWTFSWETPGGRGTFVWSLDHEETVDGVEYFVVTSWRKERDGVLSSAPTEVYFRKSDLAFYMDKVAGLIDERSMPPALRFVWPLIPGKVWGQRFTTERPREGRTWQTATRCEIEKRETMTVAAGEFRTLKIVCRDQETGSLISERWYSPDVKSWVRERVRFSYGIRERELTGFKVK